MEGTPLKDLDIPKGKWSVSQRFEQVQTAIRSNLLVSQFDALAPEDKAYLIQYWRTRDSMEAYESQLLDEELKAESAKWKR